VIMSQISLVFSVTEVPAAPRKHTTSLPWRLFFFFSRTPFSFTTDWASLFFIEYLKQLCALLITAQQRSDLVDIVGRIYSTFSTSLRTKVISSTTSCLR
jgi:hypothetical protein